MLEGTKHKIAQAVIVFWLIVILAGFAYVMVTEDNVRNWTLIGAGLWVVMYGTLWAGANCGWFPDFTKSFYNYKDPTEEASHAGTESIEET